MDQSDHTVDLAILVHQLGGDVIVRHGVQCENRMIAARIAFHPDRSNRQQPTIIAFRYRCSRVSTQTSDRQARPGKWMTMQEFGGDTQLFTNLAYFIFVKRSQRLDDPPGFDELLNTRHAIVVRLDDVGLRSAARFNGVRINGTLAQNPMAVEKMARAEDALLYNHKLLADNVPFGLRIG